MPAKGTCSKGFLKTAFQKRSFMYQCAAVLWLKFSHHKFLAKRKFLMDAAKAPKIFDCIEADDVPKIDEPGEVVEPAPADDLDNYNDDFGLFEDNTEEIDTEFQEGLRMIWRTAVAILNKEKYAQFHRRFADFMKKEIEMKCEFPASSEGASASSSSEAPLGFQVRRWPGWEKRRCGGWWGSN